MHASVLRDFKECLRFFIWHREMLGSLLACILPQDECKIEFESVKADLETSLNKLKLLQKEKHQLCIKKVFLFQFANLAPFEVTVSKEEVVRLMYTKEALYNRDLVKWL